MPDLEVELSTMFLHLSPDKRPSAECVCMCVRAQVHTYHNLCVVCRGQRTTFRSLSSFLLLDSVACLYLLSHLSGLTLCFDLSVGVPE